MPVLNETLLIGNAYHSRSREARGKRERYGLFCGRKALKSRRLFADGRAWKDAIHQDGGPMCGRGGGPV